MKAKTLLGLAVLSTSLVSHSLYAQNGVIGDGMIKINIVDPLPALGFSDPTPAPAVGGNPGLTVGEQRRNAYLKAAEIWENILSPQVQIMVQATFAPLECEADAGVLGAAGTLNVFSDFSEDKAFPLTWYSGALANELAGADQNGSEPDPALLAPPFNDEMVSFFNSELGKEGCLEDSEWYYGFDHNPPAGATDFLNVLVHELGHGLGFQSFVDEETGENFEGLPDMWSRFQRDDQLGKHWGQMINDERAWSATNDPYLVWSGPNVTAALDSVLGPQRGVLVNAPEELAGELYVYGTAGYGPAVPEAGITGIVALANDGAGDSTSDACEPLVEDLIGKIALVDRGGCFFVDKTKNAQDAGAVAVIIANNAPTGVPPLGGDDDPIYTVPTVGVTFSDGQDLRAYPDTEVTVGVDVEGTLAGTGPLSGLIKLYAPFPAQPGSSVSHYDVTASPNLLMEPFASGDLAVNDKGVDLTDELFADIGWTGQINCPVDSDDRPTVIVNGCDTGVENRAGAYTVLPSKKWIFPQPSAAAFGAVGQGCYIADLMKTCSSLLYDVFLGRQAPGQYQSCVSQMTKDMVAAGIISSMEAGAIKSCSAGTN